MLLDRKQLEIRFGFVIAYRNRMFRSRDSLWGSLGFLDMRISGFLGASWEHSNVPGSLALTNWVWLYYCNSKMNVSVQAQFERVLSEVLMWGLLSWLLEFSFYWPSYSEKSVSVQRKTFWGCSEVGLVSFELKSRVEADWGEDYNWNIRTLAQNGIKTSVY